MADISAEIQAFKDAAYGEDVRSALVSLAKKMNSRSINTGDLVDGAVTSAKLASDAVTTAKIASGSVTNAKLASDAVTRSKILDGEVISSKIHNDAITNDHLQSGCVESRNIKNLAITAGKLDTGCVSSYKLADGAVTDAKLEDSVRARLLNAKIVTPEQYGAVGDGVTDDTAAITAAIKTDHVVVFGIRKKYCVTGVTIQNAYNVIIYGNNSTLIMPYEDSNDKTILGFVHCTYIDVYNLRIQTDIAADLGGSATDIAELFSYAPYGISFIENCSTIRVIECAVGLVKDGISANDSNKIIISKCVAKNIGQEPIAVRNTDGVIIEDNDLSWHTGDGILIKAYNADRFYDIVIKNNRISLPKQSTPSSLGSLIMGGGITVNAENTTTAYLSKGVIITGNQVIGCRYGIQLTNVGFTIVANNIARVNKRKNQGIFDSGSCAFGLTLDPQWAPANPYTITKVLFANNVGSGGRSIFRSYNSDTDIPCELIVFANNVADGNDLAASVLGFDVNNATVINNIVHKCNRCGDFRNSVVMGNQFLDPWSTPSSIEQSHCRFLGEECVVKNNTIEGVQIYAECSENVVFRNNHFKLSREDGVIIKCGEESYATVMDNDYGNHPMQISNLDDMSEVSGHVYFG